MSFDNQLQNIYRSMDDSDLRQLSLCQLGPILMQTWPFLKLLPTMLILFSYLLFICMHHINNMCVLRDKFVWKWLLEGSILQMMATLLKLSSRDLI